MRLTASLKHTFRLFLFISMISMINGCGHEDDIKPAPKADFTITKAENCKAPCAVTFTSNSDNARGYNWEFGDGDGSTVNNPVHTYRAGGTYTVTLTATGDGGLDKISKTVTIESTASRVVIKKIMLEEMPANQPSGQGWDNSDGPDIYFKIYGPSPDTTTLYNSFRDVYLNRSVADLPLEWELDVPFITLAALDRDYTFELIDLDFGTDTDDQMSIVKFSPSKYIKLGTPEPYPTVITIEENGIIVKMELEWQ